mgnify:FL=1
MRREKCCPLQSSQFSHLLVFNLCLKPTFFYPLRMWEAKLIVFKKEIKRLLWYYARLYRGFEVFEKLKGLIIKLQVISWLKLIFSRLFNWRKSHDKNLVSDLDEGRTYRTMLFQSKCRKKVWTEKNWQITNWVIGSCLKSYFRNVLGVFKSSKKSAKIC